MAAAPLSERVFRREAAHVFAASPGGALPPETLPEVGFIGRSNVGKSTLINKLLGRSGLARTSSTPGATKALHFYNVAGLFHLVDMPGYGFAQMSQQAAQDLAEWVGYFLTVRRSLRLVCVLVDARRGLKDMDEQLLRQLGDLGVPAQVVLTKVDELKRPDRVALKAATEERLKAFTAAAPTALETTATFNEGYEALRAVVTAATGVKE